MEFRELLIGDKFKWDINSDILYIKVWENVVYNYSTDKVEKLDPFWDIKQDVWKLYGD